MRPLVRFRALYESPGLARCQCKVLRQHAVHGLHRLRQALFKLAVGKGLAHAAQHLVPVALRHHARQAAVLPPITASRIARSRQSSLPRFIP